MLNDVVTRALSRLSAGGNPQGGRFDTFHYAYASDDGHYVAIVARDRSTYVVDLKQDRFCAEPAAFQAMSSKWSTACPVHRGRRPRRWLSLI